MQEEARIAHAPDNIYVHQSQAQQEYCPFSLRANIKEIGRTGI